MTLRPSQDKNMTLKFKKTLKLLPIVTLVMLSSAQANNLPILGDYSSSIVSLNTEYNLGQGIIRKLRSANQSVDDPIVESYIQDLTWDLAATSQLNDKRLSITVVDSLSVNAFAAPGGVLGIHAGLILTAKAEDELASVISHELAHLSQRHFAAQLEQQRLNTPFAIASMLTGLLAAAANPKAGAAVLSSSIAGQAASQLAFSRRNEQEADRIGMLNLAKSGYSPDAMPRMFQRLLELQRLQGSYPPEFLLTHPSSTARVADSQNRAGQMSKRKTLPKSLDFSIVKARLTAQNAQKKKTPLKFFANLAKKNNTAVNRFTLALASAKYKRYAESIQNFKKLPASWRKHLLVKLSLAQVHKENNQLKKALAILKQLNAIYPEHSAIQLIYAQTLLAARQPKQAAKHLQQITEYAPDNVDAWYLLAEAHGLAGHKNALHIARIQYFLLVGHVQRAKTQISYAKRERSIKPADIYKLDDLEQEIEVVQGYLNTRF
jgi:predicted Zn-dependent protease